MGKLVHLTPAVILSNNISVMLLIDYEMINNSSSYLSEPMYCPGMYIIGLGQC